MKDFLKKIVNSFNPIGPTGAQFAVNCFATNNTDHFFLNDHSSATDIVDAINKIPTGTVGSGTYIAKGLQVKC